MESKIVTKITFFIKTNFYPIVIVIIASYLCIVNYVPNTWLSGWDTLHPEMNFGIYWQRILNSVWQEHQGLGAVATQAHASEIPRIILMQLLSLIMPVNVLRWIYFFIMLVIGPLGVYYFFLEIFKDNERYPNTKKFAFIAGLFYLLNLGTLQNFYVPLEMFATLYGYIGWLLLFVLKFINQNFSYKTIFVYGVLTFFSAPMAHTPTLWFVYFGFLTLFLICNLFLQNKPFKVRLLRTMLVLLLTIVINLYWILPTVYFAFTHSNEVANAKITRLVSEEGILNNIEYSGLNNVAILRGYLFNWRVHRGDGLFSTLFMDWNNYYRNSQSIFYIGYLVFAVVCIGAILSFFEYKKNRYPFYIFIAIGLPALLVLMMNSSPFGLIFDLLFSKAPILKEALRFPYTKFSIFLMFAYAILLGLGLMQISRIKIRFFTNTVVSVFTILLFLFMLPAFKGNLIGAIDKVKIPTSYHDAFNYLNTKENSRILTLPAPTMFGWVYYDWDVNSKVDASYQGAGFTWFLSKNPIIDREFDRWYPTNEDLYNELHYAIYSHNVEILKSILKKYDIRYVLLDRSVIAPGNDRLTDISAIEKILNEDKELSLVMNFENLIIYEFTNHANNSGYVEYFDNYVELDGIYKFTNYDANADIPNYISQSDSDLNIIFDDDLLSSINGSEIQIQKPQTNSERYYLKLPNVMNSTEKYSPAKISHLNDQLKIEYIYPKIHDAKGNVIYDQTSNITMPLEDEDRFLLNDREIKPQDLSQLILIKTKDNTLTKISNEPDQIYELGIYSAEATDCFGGEGSYGKEIDKYPNSVEIKAYNKNSCLDFGEKLQNTKPSVYQISFEYRSTAGANPLYCLSNTLDGVCINKKYTNAPVPSLGFVKYSDFVQVEDLTELKLSLILETEDKKNEQSAVFRNVTISQYTPTWSNEFDLQSINATASSDNEILLSPNQFPLTMTLPDYTDLNYKYLPGDFAYESDKKNCDNYNIGSYDRLLNEADAKKYYEYSATDAISCDYVNLRNMQQGASYLIEIDAQNYGGKYLDICLESKDIGKCLINDRLNKDGINTYFLPAYNFDSYGLGIGNQSIGNIRSINRLYGVHVKYFPYFFVKNLNVRLDASNEFADLDAKNIINQKKFSTYKYLVEVKSENDTNSTNTDSLIILNQSYEKGWTLYDADSCILNIQMPFFCKVSDAKHVLAKNWANGWIVSNQDATYLTIFWPQYLQFFGYFIFAGFISPLLFFSIIKFLRRSIIKL